VLGKSLQNTVLNITSSPGSLSILDNDLLLLLLEVGHLCRNELIKHLLLKTERRNGEIEDADLHLSLRSVVRVGDSGGHEELEFVVPGDRFVTKSELA
jgi:hypothetical protein